MCGHHYAIVPVTGLEPDTRYPYQVHVDGEQVWPPRISPYPQSLVHTRGTGTARRHRIIFGSCRYAKVVAPRQSRQLGIDATLELDNRQAAVSFAQPRTAASLAELARLELTPSPDPSDPVPLRGSQTTSRPRQQTGEAGQPPSLQPPPAGFQKVGRSLAAPMRVARPPLLEGRVSHSSLAAIGVGAAELVGRAVGVAIPLDIREPGRGDLPSRHLGRGVYVLHGRAVVHLVAATANSARNRLSTVSLVLTEVASTPSTSSASPAVRGRVAATR